MKGILSPLFFMSTPDIKNESLVELQELAEINPSRKIFVADIDQLVPYVGLPETENLEIQNVLYRPYREVKGRNIIYPGDILFARIEPSIFNKKYIFVERLHGVSQALTSTEFYILKAKQGVHPKFLFYILFSDFVFKQVAGKTTGSTGRRRLDKGAFSKLLIPKLSMLNQEKIAALMDAAHATKKAKEAEAKKLLASIDEYVLSEVGIVLPEINPRTCFTVKVSEIEGSRIDALYYQTNFRYFIDVFNKSKYQFKPLGLFIEKINYGASVKNIYTDNGIPFLRIQNLQPNSITLKGIIKLPVSMKNDIGNGFVEAGDFLISRSGSIGTVAIVPKQADGFAFGSFMIRFKLSEIVCHPFICIWLNSKIPQLFLSQEKIGAIQGNITINTIKSIPIPILPLKAQQKIAAEVQSRMDRAQALKREAAEILEKAKKEIEDIILGKNK